MSTEFPSLKIRSPDGQQRIVRLTDRQRERSLTIGRLAEFNDIALWPDPQQLVTRKAHCAIQRDSDGVWWVIDSGSVNGTFVERDDLVQAVDGRAALMSGDVIRILGRLTEDGEPIYWELTFWDPSRTQYVAVSAKRASFLEYDPDQAQLYRVDNTGKQAIEGLRPQEHKLIRYMDQRNRERGNVAVVCTYEDLIDAIWAEELHHTNPEVTQLVWRLRQKIEFDPKNPKFLQTVRGMGYRLVTGQTNKVAPR